MKNFFEEAAEFTGHACGIIARDVSEMSKPLGAAFRQGWKKAWEDQKKEQVRDEIQSEA